MEGERMYGREYLEWRAMRDLADAKIREWQARKLVGDVGFEFVRRRGG